MARPHPYLWREADDILPGRRQEAVMRAAPFPETAIFERGIDTALDGDQTNLLFVGAVHQVEKNLPRDIMVRRFDT